MNTTSVQDGDRDHEALCRRIATLDQSLEQALVAAEDAQEEARLLAEERAEAEKELAGLRQQIADLRLRLARTEAEAAGLREALGRADSRLSAIGQEEAYLTEELQTSYEELQVLTEELSRANTDLEQRVDARTAELAQANAALRSREEQLRFAQKCAGAGAWDWEVGTNRLTWSPECYDLMGLDRGGGPPSMERWLSMVLPEDLPAVQRTLKAILTGTDDEICTDFRIRHPRRGVRWIASLGRVTEREPTGRRPARIIGLSLDLSDRKAMEETLRRAKEEAENANQAKTRFLAAASHDLRQPIQAAALYAYVLRASIGSNPGAVEALDLLKASIESLNGMLSGLLDLSRLEAGAVDVTIVDTTADEVMRRLSAEFHGVAEEVGVELRCVPSTTPVVTDPQLLERVLRNLLSNAIAHGGPHGGAKGDRGRVLLGCRHRGDRLDFQVWDNGPGIPPEARGTIFEEFRQLKNPERNPTHGFGLGLSIVSRIARLLGLEVSVRSEVGRGSVFSIAVPCARTPQAVRPAISVFNTTTAAWLKGRTVLLVEDDEAVRLALSMMLKRWGVRVVAVGSTEELATRLPRLRNRPHVLVTDYRLPGGSTGQAVVELVRRRWDVPGVIITGDTAPERLREASSLGCRLLHKPVGPAELVQALGEVMHHA
ncbi:ATP-binding protein [Azospirillum sp. sgz301742]